MPIGPVARLTAARPPPSLLSLRGLCYSSLYILRCVGMCFVPVMVWPGLVSVTRARYSLIIDRSGYY